MEEPLSPADSETSENTRIGIEQRGSHTFLVLDGNMDLDAAVELRAKTEQLLSASEPVSLDWGAARHVGAGALQVLLAFEAALSARGRMLRVARDNPAIRRSLLFAGLSSHFPLAEQSA